MNRQKIGVYFLTTPQIQIFGIEDFGCGALRVSRESPRYTFTAPWLERRASLGQAAFAKVHLEGNRTISHREYMDRKKQYKAKSETFYNASSISRITVLIQHDARSHSHP
jgi:hypothetical protein